MQEIFQQAGNPFLEELKNIVALDSKNIANQNAVDNMRKVAESGAKQFNEFFNDRLKEKKTSIYEIIKKNKFAIFTQPFKPNKASNKMDITTLKNVNFSRDFTSLVKLEMATLMSSFHTRMAVILHLF